MNLSLAQFLGMKRLARTLLLNPAAQPWLQWLGKFCRADRTTWEGDRDAMLIAEGRRQVWLAIREQLDLSDEKVAVLMTEDTEDE